MSDESPLDLEQLLNPDEQRNGASLTRLLGIGNGFEPDQRVLIRGAVELA